MEESGLAFYCILFSLISDVLDGYLARKLKCCSKIGSILDPIADFFTIFLAIIAYCLKTIYPFWVLMIISIMFLQFLFTSHNKIPIHDPVGKYYGTFLFIEIGITILDVNNLITTVVLINFIIFTMISITSRINALRSKRLWLKFKNT